ncbi:MAG: hypothetical protein JW937_01095 [Candidatus Omnitrophica bacterium]|nr:hypothetical protein [Candidatus Omnitrophota bacterium]
MTTRHKGESKRDQSCRGLTLLEVVFAAGVLVLTLTGLMGLLLACFAMNEQARSMTLAMSSAELHLERVRNTVFDNIQTQFDGSRFDVPGLSPGDSEGSITVTPLNAELLEVRVAISWRGKGGRIYGEDLNLDGVLQAAEDSNLNGVLDSPVQLTTLVTRP